MKVSLLPLLLGCVAAMPTDHGHAGALKLEREACDKIEGWPFPNTETGGELSEECFDEWRKEHECPVSTMLLLSEKLIDTMSTAMMKRVLEAEYEDTAVALVWLACSGASYSIGNVTSRAMVSLVELTLTGTPFAVVRHASCL